MPYSEFVALCTRFDHDINEIFVERTAVNELHIVNNGLKLEEVPWRFYSLIGGKGRK